MEGVIGHLTTQAMNAYTEVCPNDFKGTYSPIQKLELLLGVVVPVATATSCSPIATASGLLGGSSKPQNGVSQVCVSAKMRDCVDSSDQTQSSGSSGTELCWFHALLVLIPLLTLLSPLLPAPILFTSLC